MKIPFYSWLITDLGRVILELKLNEVQGHWYNLSLPTDKHDLRLTLPEILPIRGLGKWVGNYLPLHFSLDFSLSRLV